MHDKKQLKALRLRNLKKLVTDFKTQRNLIAAVNRGIKKPEKPITASQLSSAMNETHPFGESIYRKIAGSLGLPADWFDLPDDIAIAELEKQFPDSDESLNQVILKTLKPETITHAVLYEKLSKPRRNLIDALLKDWYQDVGSTETTKKTNKVETHGKKESPKSSR